jgi:uncharacterized membrane protein YfcA
VIDLGIPIDWRLLVAFLTLLIAGIAKAVTGMGVPIAGVPILVALYGDLRLVLLLTILSTAVSDVPMLWRYRRQYREAIPLAGFLVCSIAGIFIGTKILTLVNPAILCGLLAVIVVIFIPISWFGKVPTVSPVLASRIGPFLGLLCGVVQGTAGASGPIVTSFLISIKLSRASFLFAIIAMFSVLDWTQFVSLQLLHLTTTGIFIISVAFLAIVFAGMAIGFAIQKRINDLVFRRGVLVMLAIAALGLIIRASRG